MSETTDANDEEPHRVDRSVRNAFGHTYDDCSSSAQSWAVKAFPEFEEVWKHDIEKDPPPL